MRRTLVDLLERNIARTDDTGPDWQVVVEDAVLAQDMQWVEESLALAAQRSERDEAAADDTRQHA